MYPTATYRVEQPIAEAPKPRTSTFRMLWRMAGIIWRSGLRNSFDAILTTMIRNIDGHVGELIRFEYYRGKFKSAGKNVRIDTGVFIRGAEFISLGDDVHIDKGCLLIASNPHLCRQLVRDMKETKSSAHVPCGELIIGNDVHIGQDSKIYAYAGVRIGDATMFSPGCRVYSLTSLPWNPRDRSEYGVPIMPYSGRSPTEYGAVEFGKNVWMGLNGIVLPGVVIGDDTFIRSNSLITQSCPPNSYLRGDPASRAGDRYRAKDSVDGLVSKL